MASVSDGSPETTSAAPNHFGGTNMATTMTPPSVISPDGSLTTPSPLAAPEQEHPAAAGHVQATTRRPGATGQPASPPTHSLRKWVLLVLAVFGLAGAGYFLVPRVVTTLTTVSTDDAYVNGHVTFVAPRV